MPLRSSISMRISLNSCSLNTGPGRSVIVFTLSPAPSRAGNHCLPQSAGWDGPLGVFANAGISVGILVGRAKLRERFVELIGQLDQLADGSHGAARSLRRLPRNAGNDLHGVRDAFRAPDLLFGSERNFLDEFGGLTNDVGNGVESASGLRGEVRAASRFL